MSCKQILEDMTQLVINIEDASVKSALKQALLKVMGNFKGVSFDEDESYTLDDALEEVSRGEVLRYESVDDFFNHLRREI